MNFSEAVKAFFTNYVNFSGRAGRAEFWWAYVFLIIGNILTSLLDGLIGDDSVLINGLWSLVIFLPSLSILVRRFHDIGKNGWNVLWFFIPIVGLILFIVWFVKESVGPNQWGLPAEGYNNQPPFNGGNGGQQNPYNQGQQQSGYAGYSQPQQPNPYQAPYQPQQGYAQPEQPNPYQAPQQPFAAPQQQPGPYGANPLPPRPEQFGQQYPYGAPQQPNPYTGQNDPNRNPYQG